MSVCSNCGHQALEPLSPPLHDGYLSTREQRRAALVKVRAQLLFHEKHIDALKKEEAELQAGLALVTYPVLTLPVEITSSIFLHCLPSHGHVIPSPLRAPLLLAQICHRWREVALSTGELWNSLYPSYSLIKAQVRHDWHPLCALMQTWFCRAKAAPLSLGLNCPVTRVSPALLELISSFAGQIKRLDIHLQSEQFRELRPFQLTRFPLLQHLAMSHSSYAEIGDVLNDTPSLRELRLVGIFTHWTSFNFPLPLLNRLEIAAEISITTFLEVLNNFPVLSHFNYRLMEPDTNGVDGSMAQMFPHLSSLAGNAAALCFVTLPGLCELELPSFSKIDHVQQFLTRSSCTVERLTLDLGNLDWDVDGSELLIWLTAFPSLSALKIDEYSNTDILIDCLDSGSLMPRLSEIIIDSTIRPPTSSHDYGPLVALLRRRTDPHRSIKLRKFHMVLFEVHDESNEEDPAYVYRPDLLTPSDLTASALNDIIADGLDFFLEIQSTDLDEDLHTLRWPPTYVNGEPSLPFHS
ncbi:hypothetical protein C8J57DRAFT_1530292 [Mycena rebaudengoi]|nr:hypothetical protein C8J57DRAFT_1530292 [Mycena rebaudengoi]